MIENKNENILHQSVLSAITGALREEKVPVHIRLFKVIGCSLLLVGILAILFLTLFEEQMNQTWKVVGLAWFFYFLAGFALLYRPQARLVVPGVWSPFMVARIFLISTLLTIFQIIICPSFVFLESPIPWNPLLPLTEGLMLAGGMKLCMGFCGLLFTVIAGGTGLYSVREINTRAGPRNFGIVLAILVVTQLPVLYLQWASPDLNPFAVYWMMGMMTGFLIIFAGHALIRKLFSNSKALSPS